MSTLDLDRIARRCDMTPGRALGTLVRRTRGVAGGGMQAVSTGRRPPEGTSNPRVDEPSGGGGGGGAGQSACAELAFQYADACIELGGDEDQCIKDSASLYGGCLKYLGGGKVSGAPNGGTGEEA